MAPVDRFLRCPDCGYTHWTSKGCPPLWDYRVPEWDGDDWRQIRANSALEAAEKACERDDVEVDYAILNAGYLDVIEVRDPGTKMIQRFKITAESEPVYTADVI